MATRPFFDGAERSDLCDLLDDLGPGAPTLLPGWTTLDLAAHLVLREHVLRAAPGLVVPGPWSSFAERRRLVLKQTAFPLLVESVRRGPPRGFFRIGWVRRMANLNEFFVHHEDVRRANGRAPRILPLEEDAALFRNVGGASRFLTRRLRGAGVELVWAGTTEVVPARRQPAARVCGRPGELLLYLFGRGAAADVEISGHAGAIAALERTSFGM